MCHAPKKFDPIISEKNLNFPKIFSVQSTPIDVATQKFIGPQGPSKNVRVPDMNFGLGGPDPQRGVGAPTRGGAR